MSKVTSQNTNFQIQNQQNQCETNLTQDKTQIWKANHFVQQDPSYSGQLDLHVLISSMKYDQEVV
jgi:hypothetical protein